MESERLDTEKLEIKKIESKKKGLNKLEPGKLFICATPIGNLKDASLRLIETLDSSDFIIAEDTRTVRKILSKYNVTKPVNNIISYQDYSGQAKIDFICTKLLNGSSIALVSESGIPSIQDPGYRLVLACIEKNIPVSVIPGPNAALSALVISGLPTDSFLFIGFLPKSQSKRRKKISEIKYLTYTLIFYESPLRIKELLKELLEQMGNRKACIAREMTKIYEESIRGTISEILELLKNRKIKGEIVLVVEGYKKEYLKVLNDSEIKKEFIELLSSNISKKEAIKIIKSRYDIERQKIYNILLI
ncbi:MAG: 16S rRNA (cytidine(1402)-2'-O)-methyltransferase [Actinobacteria bacterium]|nr:16S rRNA (cytidine(1402)-2'-O)-methyltransferase [Actinomycetota bacterium]